MRDYIAIIYSLFTLTLLRLA